MFSERDDEAVRALRQTLKVGEPNGAISQRLVLCLEAVIDNYCMS
jgi:hypothetical protein